MKQTIAIWENTFIYEYNKTRGHDLIFIDTNKTDIETYIPEMIRFMREHLYTVRPCPEQDNLYSVVTLESLYLVRRTSRLEVPSNARVYTL